MRQGMAHGGLPSDCSLFVGDIFRQIIRFRRSSSVVVFQAPLIGADGKRQTVVHLRSRRLPATMALPLRRSPEQYNANDYPERQRQNCLPVKPYLRQCRALIVIWASPASTVSIRPVCRRTWDMAVSGVSTSFPCSLVSKIQERR